LAGAVGAATVENRDAGACRQLQVAPLTFQAWPLEHLEEAAVEFKTDFRKLIAVRRLDIA
jgi:hypothetical protein